MDEKALCSAITSETGLGHSGTEAEMLRDRPQQCRQKTPTRAHQERCQVEKPHPHN